MMTGQHNPSPGTVSKILWHFTGGAPWDAGARKQGESPKPVSEAYENLISILQTRQLRLGTYKEIVKVLRTEHVFNARTGEHEVRRDVPEEIESHPVCCLADIPVPHLWYLASRYGKFAIGFRRDAVISHGFNPVFYMLRNMPIIGSIYDGLASLKSADPAKVESAADYIESTANDLVQNGIVVGREFFDDINRIRSERYKLDKAMSATQKSLQHITAFVKTLERSDLYDVYCEREWRSTEPYAFDFYDVAMITLPRQADGVSYVERFIDEILPRLETRGRVPVVPWEDLVEH